MDDIWKGQRLRWISIKDIVRSLGQGPKALLFFHVCIFCDIVSVFVSKGKKTALKA